MVESVVVDVAATHVLIPEHYLYLPPSPPTSVLSSLEVGVEDFDVEVQNYLKAFINTEAEFFKTSGTVLLPGALGGSKLSEGTPHQRRHGMNRHGVPPAAAGGGRKAVAGTER